MTVLLQMLACQEKLFVGFNLFWQQCSLSAIRDRPDLIAFSMPGHHTAFCMIQGLKDFQVQLVELSPLHSNSLYEHAFW